MMQSESIGKLAEALSKAQGVIEGAKKDSDNLYFKNKYADLASVWDAIRKPLADNGLAVIQTGVYVPEHPDMVAIETMIVHASGQWKKGLMTAKPVKPDPQSLGSCVTYLRRYSLLAIAGVCPEDDDGAAASGTVAPKKWTSAKGERFAKEPLPKVDGMGNEIEDVPDMPDEDPSKEIGATHEAYKTLMEYISAAQWDTNKVDAFIEFLNNYPTSVDGTDKPKRVLLNTKDLRDMTIADARYLTEQRRWNSAITVFYNSLRKKAKAA